MTADAKECNGGCEGKKVEFEGKVELGVVLEGDRKRREDYNGIACREGEENGGDGSEGSFVMVHEGSDDPVERDLDPRGKAVPVDAEESGGPPANVGPLLEDVAFGDREAGGEKGGIGKEGVDSVVNSENGVEDRKDETAVSDSAEEETMESKTNTVAEAEDGRGASEDNNGVVNNEGELEEERKEEIVAMETEFQVEPESLAEVQEKSEAAMTETDDQIRTEFTVKVEEGQETETVATETDHQGKLVVGAETKDQLELGSLEVEEKQEYMTGSIETDHQAELKSEVENVVTETKHQLESKSSVEVQKQDDLTANRSIHDQVETKSAVVVETPEPQIVSMERNDQEQSEAVVQKEDKQERMTLVSETKDQAELQSAEVELKEMTEVAGDQDEPEAIVRVREEEKPESVVTETPASESLPLEHEKVGLSNEAGEGSPDDCSAENAASSEPQCETSLQKADSRESAESHEASITSHLDGVVKEAESSGDPENSKNSSVYHVGDQEFLKEVKVNTKSAENGETSPTETEIRTEFTVKVEEGQETETVATETDHQGKLVVGAETKDQLELGSLEVEEKQEYMTGSIETDHQAELKSEVENVVTETKHQLESKSSVEVQKQDDLTANRSIHDQVETKSAVVVETPEPQIVSMERNDQEQSELVVQKEDKQERMTLVSETKDQAELQSAEVELKEVTEVAGDQDEPEAIVRVREEEKPESVVTETPASESLPLEHEKVGLSNEAEEGSPDDCSAENAASSEPQCKTSLQKSDSRESAESHEASITSHLDGVVKEAESSGDPENSKNSSVYHVGDQEFLKEVKVSTKSAENGETSPTETETGIHHADGPGPSGPVSGAVVESQITNASINSGIEVEKVLVQRKESTVVCSNNDTGLENKVCNDVEIENHAGAMESDSRIGYDSAEGGEYLASSVEGDQATRKDDDEEPISEEVQAVKVIQAPPEDPSGSALDGERVDIQVAKRQPCYIIRVPRFTDDELWAQIQHAKLELEEKTRSRDSIRVSVQKKKATCNEFREKLETAKAKEKAVRAAYNAKRQELDSVQSMLSKIKNATSIEEIDNKIEAMEREFQHSTIGLKEEKQHVLDIRQLRQRREQLCSNMGPKSEIDMAFDQRDQIEERFKTLKKELDSLKADLSEAETKGKEAWKEYDDQVQHLKDPQEQFRIADEIRQKAYGHWRNLKDESIEKSKYFYMYKNDKEAAANYLSSGDRKGLWLHCSKQVEKIMELWNNHDEFRMQYVKSNKNSTLRRLKTLDGRSLGPDEEPPALHATADKSSSSVSNSSNTNPPAADIASEAKPHKLDVLSASKQKESFPPLQTAQTNQSSKSKKCTKPTSKETIMAPVSDREEVEAAPKENSRTKEEEEQARKMEELARKEEELRKVKAEAEMKEQLRLEQKAKAKEAEERKRRQTEKAQARAEYRAHKEAELREKKKLKKEKKKAAATSNTTNGGVGDHAPSPATDGSLPENAPEPDNQSVTASKRPSRALVAAKQYNKIPPVPLPLRNRGKRKMRTWMWVFLIPLLVLVFFLASNYMAFSFSL